jgi:hypothetical protein
MCRMNRHTPQISGLWLDKAGRDAKDEPAMSDHSGFGWMLIGNLAQNVQPIKTGE